MSITAEMTAKAFEIADQSMRSLIECHCVREDSFGHLFSPTNTEGSEVHSLADADPVIIEAVEWLVARDLASVFSNTDGDVVYLMD